MHIAHFEAFGRRHQECRIEGHHTGPLVMAFPLLTVTDDGQHVVRTDAQRVKVLDAEDGGALWNVSVPRNVVHVTLARDQLSLLVVQTTQWERQHPFTTITSVGFETGRVRHLAVPNCAAPLTVPSVGDFVFMAPTVCWVPEGRDFSGDRDQPRASNRPRRNVDPISVIHAPSHQFLHNLPGFGPVSATRDGDTVIGFLDLENVDPALFESVDDIPEGDRYQLMFVDPQTLSYEFLPIGDRLPRHTITPNGDLLLVDFPDGRRFNARMRVVDIRDRAIHTVSGPYAHLNSYVMTSDSSAVYFLYEGLKKLDLDRLEVIDIPLAVSVSGINLTPDDAHLLLRTDDTAIKVLDLAGGKIVRSMELTKEGARASRMRDKHTFVEPTEPTKDDALAAATPPTTPDVDPTDRDEVDVDVEMEADAPPVFDAIDDPSAS